MLAIALARQPRLLLADEPTTALDVTIQAQILRLLVTLQRELGMALILVTHDLGVVYQAVDRVAVMYAGEIVELARDGRALRPAEPPVHDRPDPVDSQRRPPASADADPGLAAGPGRARAGDARSPRAAPGSPPSAWPATSRCSPWAPTTGAGASASTSWRRPDRAGAGWERRASPPLLEVRDLVKHFPLPHTLLDVALRRAPEHVRAVDGVSFTLARGRTLGLVGESGCGKSTLGRCLLRLYDADRGEVRFDGVDLMGLAEAELAPYRKRMQVVFQDPYASLNPRQRVDRMLHEVLEVHAIGTPADRRRRVDELLVQVGLSPADGRKYPGEFSGGQRQRIGIARALAVEPELLIADEPLSALDVSIQAQILQLLLDLRESLGLTMIFISHDLRVVRYLSDEVAVMYLGRIVERAPTAELFARPQHPYTMALLSAVPEVGGARREPTPIEGEPPSAVRIPSGCRFHPRCPWKVERCVRESPELDELAPGHLVACHVAAARPATLTPSANRPKDAGERPGS